MDSLTITSDSLRLASDSLNFFMKVLPEIKMQLCILKPLSICLSFMLLIDFLTGVRKAKALGEKAGENNKEADKVACIRTLIVLSYVITNIFIIAGVIRHW